jgi:Family of unknown function (DUF6452)
MKKIFLLLFVFSLLGCEKDDICDANTSTTPRLVIELYDNTTITPTTKALTKMKAVADGMDGVGVVFYPTLATNNNDRYLSNDKKIYLPLKTGESDTFTTYSLTLNSGVTGSENTDVVTFSYDKNKVFVSRACGYKMLFNLTNTNTNILSPDSDNWIKNIIILKPNLETETDVHIQIYF